MFPAARTIPLPGWPLRPWRIKPSSPDDLGRPNETSRLRTNPTFDDDVLMVLKKKSDEYGKLIHDVVNRILRVGLIGDDPCSQTLQIPQPRSMGGARVDLDQALSLAEGRNDNVLVEQLRG